jgi:hypothetical protein
MDWPTRLEAQFLLRHRVPSAHPDRHPNDPAARILAYAWEEDLVRRALAVPLDDRWQEHLLALELAGLAVFCMHAAPVTWDEEGTAQEVPGWQDQPREHWGSLSIFPAGVLRLATAYGRPYVTYAQAPEVLVEHWRLVQEEGTARLHAPHDMGRWQQEFPEDYAVFQALTQGLLPGDDEE